MFHVEHRVRDAEPRERCETPSVARIRRNAKSTPRSSRARRAFPRNIWFSTGLWRTVFRKRWVQPAPEVDPTIQETRVNPGFFRVAHHSRPAPPERWAGQVIHSSPQDDARVPCALWHHHGTPKGKDHRARSTTRSLHDTHRGPAWHTPTACIAPTAPLTIPRTVVRALRKSCALAPHTRRTALQRREVPLVGQWPLAHGSVC